MVEGADRVATVRRALRGGDRDMDRAERQVQVDGQIKSGDRGFHGVKGLRQVIGFVNERYLAELERQLDGRNGRWRTPTAAAGRWPTP